MTQSTPSFNLWHEPWITVERLDGKLDILNIRQVLTKAHHIRALYEPSPLDGFSIHRLLVAILQDAYQPESRRDLKKLWQDGQFSTALLQPFEQRYAARFDLFSAKAPFLQSADLSLQPAKTDKPKPVGYLLLEQPAGTAVTHYTHAYDDTQQFCSHCAAKGLLVIPAFASSGGAGIKPSINGVPPIYVLPGGQTLFASLCASLTL
ncbi:MAG: type I-E CRISPR-associated protein Cse1/CasA, partial [Anaerolineae bacterium]|nr:type I-E CRISPR-associated protein Cse1/CasA [Anaerolineae bacterium]